MQATNQTEATLSSGPLAGRAIIRVEEIHKYYELGETRVHALRGVSAVSYTHLTLPTTERV